MLNIGRTHNSDTNRFQIHISDEHFAMTLNENQASQVFHQYQAACLTEYIFDNYDITMKYARVAGDIADELMTFHEMEEEEAIQEALKEVKERANNE